MTGTASLCIDLQDSSHACHLALDLQDYIESENARLEREQQFWAKEIVVKIEYKFCPNLTIIDTPGQQYLCVCCGSWQSQLYT